MTAEGSAAPTGMNLDPMTLLGTGRLRQQLATTILAIVLGLVLGGVLIVIAALLQGRGFQPGLPFVAYRALLDGAFLCDKGFADNAWTCDPGSWLDVRSLGNTLNVATPLTLAGLSVAFGFRAGLFNIGAQGQFLVGAFVAAVVGSTPFIGGPAHLAAALLAGMLGGALWGFIPGILKAWRGAHEVVTTIMLNYTAYLLLNWLAGSPGLFRDPGASLPRTREALPDAQFGPILDTRAHWGYAVAVVVAIGVWFLLFRTTLGFEIRTVGINAFAAKYAGIRTAFIAVLTMSIAGGLAGLGGAAELLGVVKGYPAEFITNYGFEAIAVALLARAHPFGVIGAALLFGALHAGAGTMARASEMPQDIIFIIQSLIILFVAAEAVLRRLLPNLRARRAPTAAAA